MGSSDMCKHILKYVLLAALMFLGRKSGIFAAEPLPGDTHGSQLIRTPPVSPKPRINGARIFGARPGAPFLFTIVASGQKPLRFSVTDLPAGICLDAASGRLSGSAAVPGAYNARVTVANALGRADATLRIVIGDTLCLTPPMAWNSWYCWSESVSQEHLCAAADALVASGLAEHGWASVNVDDCWQGERTGPDKALQGNERFPDMKRMCDYIHSRGLKVGIYSTPWMGSYAGFPGGSCWKAEGNYADRALAPAQRLQSAQLFGRFPGSLNRGLDKVGEYWFCDADARQWAAWGIDYVKYDWKPNDVPTTRRLAEGLRRCGRDIVLSLSNESPFEKISELSKLANLWRTTGDIQESWASISRIGFSQERWRPFGRPGHWNDPDMLQVGMLGAPNQKNVSAHPSALTPEEQYSQVTLWCLLSAPLVLSCDLTRIDPFTFNLLGNDEVIEVDQDPRGEPARRIVASSGEVWAKTLEDGSLAVGLFNLGQEERPVAVSWSELGITGKQKVRDLWRQKNLGEFESRFAAPTPPHGVELVRLVPARRASR